jgi:hypothetical protein
MSFSKRDVRTNTSRWLSRGERRLPKTADRRFGSGPPVTRTDCPSGALTSKTVLPPMFKNDGWRQPSKAERATFHTNTVSEERVIFVVSTLSQQPGANTSGL